MWQLFISLVFFVPQASYILPAHDFHVSKTEIHYRSGEEALQVSVHLFIDDLELALRRDNPRSLRLFTEKEDLLADSLIQDYLLKNLRIRTDIDELRLVYIGREISNDLMGAWCYLEQTGVQDIETMEISNEILYEVFDDQRNIVSVKKDNRSKAFQILDAANKTMKLDF